MTNKRNVRITLNAPVVIGLVVISFFATLCNYITSGTLNRFLFMTYHSTLLSPMTWGRAFTHIFGHADWEHLISNMSYILLLGPMLEEKYTVTNIGRSYCDNCIWNEPGQLYIFSFCGLMWSKWRCICIYPAIFFYWI